MNARAHEAERLAGRMLMVGVRGARADDPALRRDLDACAHARVGGVILFDVDLPAASALESAGVPRAQARAGATRNIESPAQVRALCEALRSALGEGLIVSVDQEGGEVARLSTARGFACALSAEAFAALPAERRRPEADALAATVAGAGIDLNFAPCVDVAVHPDGPVIARKRRAFSADPEAVAACAAEAIEAHAARGVLPCVKHFPGHGSADADSHLGFTDITRTYDAPREIAPYRLLLDRFGADDPPFWVMTGHLLDARVDPALPASLSAAHTTGALRGALGFAGVIVTDSLDMRAVADRWGPEEAAVLAVRAGADVLLDGVNAPGPARPCPAPAMRDAIARAATDGAIEGGVERLAGSVARIERSLAQLRRWRTR